MGAINGILMGVYAVVLASRDFCHLLITIANSFDPDQGQLNLDPDLDPNHLTL